jgi:hypothetical protein
MDSDLFLVYGAYILAALSAGSQQSGNHVRRDGERRGSAMAMAAGVVRISFTCGLVAASSLAAMLLRYVRPS